MIDPDDFSAIADFLNSINLILVSIYRLGRRDNPRSYSVAAALSRTEPVLLMTVDIQQNGLVVDDLNKCEKDMSSIRLKIYHQQFFHMLNGTGVLALRPMYLDNPLDSLKHHEFEIPMQLREFLNVET